MRTGDPMGTAEASRAMHRLLARGAEALASAGRAGNVLAKLVSSNNKYVRLRLSSMGRGPKSPALRFGNATSDVGRYLSHVDLVTDFRFSPQVRSGMKFVKKTCG